MIVEETGPVTEANGFTWLSISLIILFWVQSIGLASDPAETAAMTLPQAFRIVVVMNTIILGMILGLMRLERDRYATLGFNRNRMGAQLLAGAVLGVLMFVFQAVFASVAGAIVNDDGGVRVTSWFQSLEYIPMWAVMIVYGGGLGEELTRVFVLTRFEKVLGRAGLAFAVVMSAAVFGAAHLYQGPRAAVGLGIMHVIYSMVFIRRRSALEMITAHAIFDVIGVTLGFYAFHEW